MKDITINDNSWSDHPLSSSKVNGLQANIETSLYLNSYIITSDLSYQNFSLDKANYKEGFNLRLRTEYTF